MNRTIEQGGQQTRRFRDRRGAEVFAVSPFQRLARTHALSVAGDALLAVALADSLFFSVDPSAARWRVGAYLLLTLAPFAIVAPVLGPVMDRLRGGHRFMIIGTAVVRAALMAALVLYVQRWPLFPLAFGMLVMGKTYAVAKSAVVPTTVADERELVRSNSRLSVLSAFAWASAGAPGILLLKLGGAPWVLALGVVAFLGAAVLGTRIPATRVAAAPAEWEEKAELRSTGILLASSAQGFLRGGTGFITMLLAFDLRGGIDPGPKTPGVEIGHHVRGVLGLERLDLATGGAPPWHFGVALVGVGVGGLLGSAGVPRLRSHLAEERILAFALIGLTALSLVAAIATGLAGAFIMAVGIALATQGGKQAFDAIVQRDAPRANLGRTFSRYESRFQLVWVLGALLPVVAPLPARAGFIMMAAASAFVAATYWFGRTPNPAAMVSDGVVDDGLDRLASTLPGPLARRVPSTRATRGRRDEPDRSTTPEPDRSTTPEPDRSTMSEPDRSTMSEPDRSTTPEPDRTTTSESDRTTPMPRPRPTTGPEERSGDEPADDEPASGLRRGRPVRDRPSRRRPRR